jgi:type III restriction enzyme
VGRQAGCHQSFRYRLEELARKFRMQKIIFETARDVYDQMKKDWKGSKELLLAQLYAWLSVFQSDKIQITPALFYQDDMKRGC